MEILYNFLCLEISSLLMGMILVVIYQILMGRINTHGMLSDKKTRRFSPGRAQLLFFTFIGVLYYLLQIVHDPEDLPDLPQELLYLIGGSNVVYLGGKAYSMLSLFYRHKAEH